MDDIKIHRSVKQGCKLSPLLFNIYSQQIFEEALADLDAGILLNEEKMNNIRHADDTFVIMDRVTSCSQRYDLDINVNKTKLMVISKNKLPNCHLDINQQNIERVNKYTYFGTNINNQWDHS